MVRPLSSQSLIKVCREVVKINDVISHQRNAKSACKNHVDTPTQKQVFNSHYFNPDRSTTMIGRSRSFLVCGVVVVVYLICAEFLVLRLEDNYLETTTTSLVHDAAAAKDFKTIAEPKLFNPFTDMKLSLVTTRQPIFSSRHCIRAQDKDADENVYFVSRTCHFRNLYFRPKTGTFHYFPDPREKSILLASDDVEAAWQQLESDMTVAAGNIWRRDAKDLGQVPPARIWHPVIERNSTPPNLYAKIDRPSNLALLVYRPWYSFNIGHFLWDDAFSLFSMMDLFGLKGSSIHEAEGENHPNENDDDKVFPLPFYTHEKGFDGTYYPCDVSYKKRDTTFKQRWELCTKTYHRMFPNVFRYETHKTGDILRSGNWLNGEDQEWRGFRSDELSKNESSNLFDVTKNVTNLHGQDSPANQLPQGASFVLVPTVVAGIGRLGQSVCDGDCGIGRAAQFRAFREFLLGNILWPNYNSIQSHKKADGPKCYITFSLPVGSSRPKEVSFFENIIPIAKTLYGEDRVKVVDMAKLSAQEEAMLALDTSVLFVNHGGGSTTSIFLPRDASVFLYTAGRCRQNNPWCDEGKNHYDSVFYNGNGYVRQHWIEEGDRDNTEMIKAWMQREYEQTLDIWGVRQS